MYIRISGSEQNKVLGWGSF